MSAEELAPWLLGVMVWVGYAVQNAFGFGAGLLIMGVCAHVLPISDLVRTLIPLSLVQTGYMLVRYRGNVAWRMVFTRAVPLMGGGVALGRWLNAAADSGHLVRIYGVCLALLAAWELRRTLRAGPEVEVADRPAGQGGVVAGVSLGLAGVIHALYATGGPLLVYGLSRLGLDKQAFRSTLCAVFFGINVGLTIGFVSTGTLDATVGWRLCTLAPVVALLSIPTGEWAHGRFDERRFRQAVFSMLILSGVGLAL